MAEDKGLFSILDALVESWCERRALNPLRILLAVYPMASGLSDEWQDLYQALRLIRSQYGKGLPAEEQNRVGEAVVLIGQRLHPNNADA